MRLSAGIGDRDRPTVRTALIAGLGGGLAPRLLAMHGIECESVEIDPVVIEIARREFAFTGRVTPGDGRAVLSLQNHQYDLIFLDVCTGDRLPWHSFTIEALRLVRKRLTPNGILAIQFIGDDGPWSASLVRTAEAVFGQRHGILLAPAVYRNSIGPRWFFIAHDAPVHLPTKDVSLGHPMHWRRIEPSCTGALLTDDHFPAELAWARTARQWRAVCGQR